MPVWHGLGTFESEVKTNSYLTQLETLISLAEKDGINVVDEKASLSLLNSLHPAKTDEIVLSSIANVILKAKSKYEIGRAHV